ncbi:hypothetical protein [Polyangium aurulentum]|uniref:hypothetical protein n=1 Tax=Polyangium aurulentum TaxID=2567896 RepID=UPI0010AE38A8|nr:hypothetical protein [Polyangium aurulentum]UQA60241.1 hypothetical protein E8A73_007110 [Polyangium aurulentum]
MSYRSLTAASSLVAVLFILPACGGAPPPPPPPPDTVAEEEPPPPPPKPKKCESLDEDCKAKASTKAKVKSGALVFKPTEGWVYAQTEEHTLAQSSADGAALIIGTYATEKDAKKDAANRDAAFDALLKSIGVTAPKQKVAWKKPQMPKEIAGLKLGLWELGEVERGESKKKGPLLVVQGNLPEGRALIAVGFAPADQADSAEKIMASIDTLAPDENAEKADKGGEEKAPDKAGSGSK